MKRFASTTNVPTGSWHPARQQADAHRDHAGMNLPRTPCRPVKVGGLHQSPLIPVPPSLPVPRSPWRYLRDHGIQHAAVVTVPAVLPSAGLVWLGYLIPVCRIAGRSPLAPTQRMIARVFGRRLAGDIPGQDYRQHPPRQS